MAEERIEKLREQNKTFLQRMKKETQAEFEKLFNDLNLDV